MFASMGVRNANLGVDERDTEDVSEEKKDLVFRVVLRGRSDIRINAIDLLYLPLRVTLPSSAWRLLMSAARRRYGQT